MRKAEYKLLSEFGFKFTDDKAIDIAKSISEDSIHQYKNCPKKKELMDRFQQNFDPFLYIEHIFLIIIGYLKYNNRKLFVSIMEEEIYIFEKISLMECAYYWLPKSLKKDFKDKYEDSLRSRKEINKIIKENSYKYKKIVDNFNQISQICEKGKLIEKEIGSISQEEYESWKYPRYGSSNPQKIKSKFWEYGVVSKKSAYLLAKEFGFSDNYETKPLWSYDRFGRAIIFLEDSTEIHIAGEHEDHYDPDFFIYNDITVIHPDNSIDFYIYPRDLFIPTDFHSATLMGNKVYIIGNLGYGNDRKYGYTQVYELNLDTFMIKKIKSVGEMPGWIHKHKAKAIDKVRIEIKGGYILKSEESDLVENNDIWIFNIQNYNWTKNTNSPRTHTTRCLNPGSL